MALDRVCVMMGKYRARKASQYNLHLARLARSSNRSARADRRSSQAQMQTHTDEEEHVQHTHHQVLAACVSL